MLLVLLLLLLLPQLLLEICFALSFAAQAICVIS